MTGIGIVGVGFMGMIHYRKELIFKKGVFYLLRAAFLFAYDALPEKE